MKVDKDEVVAGQVLVAKKVSVKHFVSEEKKMVGRRSPRPVLVLTTPPRHA